MKSIVKGERKKRINKAFTLMEMLIVLVIFGILSAVMFRTYNKISEISFRTQREKNLNQEIVYLSQVLQNLSDDYTIDYAKYNQGGADNINLIKKKWITPILHLKAKKEDSKYETIALSSQWNCPAEPTAITNSNNQEWCRIAMKVKPKEMWKTEETVALTDTKKVLFTPVQFKVIPYAPQEDFYKWDGEPGKATCKDEEKNWVAKCIASNGFWILTTAYIPYYREDKWINKVKVVVQNFFNN